MVKTVVKTSNPGLQKLIFVVYKKFLHLNICFEAPFVYSKKLNEHFDFGFMLITTMLKQLLQVLQEYCHISDDIFIFHIKGK